MDNSEKLPGSGPAALEPVKQPLADLMLPSEEQAEGFAVILSAGVPSEEAIRYFIPAGDEWTPAAVAALHDKWVRSKRVGAAVKRAQGKGWEEMNLDERIKLAVDKNYTEMAYFLYSHNYAAVQGADKVKADTCRTTLEAKLAGLAGKLDPLARFYDDFLAGRIKVPALAETKVGRA